jgi:predicted transcriptional regulator of viral defense system
MNALEAYQRLKKFTAFRTVDAATLLKMNMDACTKLLSRLSTQKLLIKVCRGLWTWPDTDPNLLPELISAPLPSYISFQSALYSHGLISQIPRVIYAATLARARQVRTPLGTISFHHLPPELFGGFESHGPQGVKLATPEKALVDMLYLAPVRSRLFAKMPELELPKNFDFKAAQAWIDRIPSEQRRQQVRARVTPNPHKKIP